MIRYGSVCSGIEAASVAWHPLGWQPAFFSEIERFPCEVLAHHYGSNLPGEDLARNGVPNLGDMTKFMEWPDAAIDVLVGGTPCQSFSVAGLRAGLADPRGNLMLTYLAIAARYRPRWLVWENVPGVLSSGDGRDFGTFLQGLGELGYGFAYRVLDAQYVRVGGFGRAVPQRRRRVFVVGYLGDWRRAAAVFFDGASLRGDSAPRRQAGEGVAPTISSRPTGGGGLGADFDLDGGLIAADVSGPLSPGAHPGGFNGQDAYEGKLLAFGGNDTRGPISVATAVNAHGGPAGRLDFESETFVVPHVAASLTRGAESAGKGGYAGRRQEDDVNLIAQPYTLMERGRDGSPVLEYRQDGTSNAILTPNGGRGGLGVGAVAFAQQAGGDQTTLGYDPDAGTAPTLSSNQTPGVHHGWAVRRLTPTECERLQGFPDGYTLIPRGSKLAADGPRYKALGNSMAINCMRWVGERIAMVDAIPAAREEAA